MAKKNPNNQGKSLLSERMKKTSHGTHSGIHTQQTEINIFVAENENNQDNNSHSFSPNGFVQQPVPPTTIATPPPQPPIPMNNIPQNEYNPIDNLNNSIKGKQTNGKFHIKNTSQPETPNEQEFVFNADTTEEPLQEYVSPFKKEKKKTKEKKQRNIGENAIDGSNGNPFEKPPLSKKAKLVIILSLIALIIIIPQLLFRIPALFNDKKGELTAKVTNNIDTITSFVSAQNGMEDWDKDGVLNSEDKNVWDPDVDKNGIPDGDTVKTFITKTTPVNYENITVNANNQKVGISKFLDYYIFTNFKGWAKIESEKGVPYIYKKDGWTKAKYRKDSNTFYVYIPCDCRVEFLKTDAIDVYRTDLFKDRAFASKEARYVKGQGIFAPIESFFLKLLIPVTEPTSSSIASFWYTTDYHLTAEKNIKKADAIKASTENYDLSTLKNYDFSYDKLYGLYNKIDTGKTNLLSIITKNGEVTCYAYAYDYLGNIYIADAQTLKTLGCINIYPKSQTYLKDEQIFIREWYEFEGVGLSSADGDYLFIY